MQTRETFYQDEPKTECCGTKDCDRRYQAAVDAYKYIKLQLLHAQNKLREARDKIDEMESTHSPH